MTGLQLVDLRIAKSISSSTFNVLLVDVLVDATELCLWCRTQYGRPKLLVACTTLCKYSHIDSGSFVSTGFESSDSRRCIEV